jgi:acetyl esterase/lipase
MNAGGTAGRALVGLMIGVLLAGCASGAITTHAPATPAPASPINPPSAMVATPTAASTTSPTPTLPASTVRSNVLYESADPVLTPDGVDIYAPTKAGSWPVVVMFHGYGGPTSNPATDRAGLGENARRVAELGFVVFNASWGHAPGGADQSWYDGLLAVQSQGACAVEFARAHAAEYGGDPAAMIVFGFSGGANTAAMVAFARPEPTAGCLGGPTLGAIDALVTWEGNWLLSTNRPDWDGVLAADPRVMDAVTPWKYLAGHKDQKVGMLVSESPGSFFEREVGDLWAADSWLAVRDPSGDLRRQLEANGALADGTVGQADADRLLYSVLKAQGNPVSLDVMPGSSHGFLSDAGWKVFLAAFPKAAAKD